jgi:predicted dienelactone hydrolase
MARLAAFLLAVLLAPVAASAAGFQYGSAPGPDGKAIELGIWYPSDAATSPQPLGVFTQQVAPYAPITGQALPLIVISHGTGGGASSHYDTAIALADAGFVVVAPTHTGDNYQDQSVQFTWRNFIGRPIQVSQVVDYMLNGWGGHASLDPMRIGMFGHSAGGFTTLIVLGGIADPSLAALFCRDHADDWGCQRAKEKSAGTPADPNQKPPEWRHDPRVRAAAIAAPALGHSFTKDGLAAVTEPVQLWRAENDNIAPNKGNSDVIKAALPKPPDDHLVPKAGHFDFLAPCSEALAKIAPEICRSDPGFDRVAFHREFNQALVDFFKAKLAPP